MAQFVGYRAGALGGAQIAVADGSSATLWNPGMLGFTHISEAGFGRAATAGDGVETYSLDLALAHPWRGTAGTSLRLSALRHEAEPVSIGPDSEFEARVAYGRRASRSWGVGGALTVRRASAEEWATTAVGLDLGTAIRPGTLPGSPAWLERTSVGLTLWNAVEPSFGHSKSSNDPGIDPLVVGLGAAKQFLSSERSQVLLAWDLRAGRGRNLTSHTGVEIDWARRFALRLGLDERFPTAGVGLQWRQAALDYSWNRTSGPSEHRVGVRWALAAVPDWIDARRDALSERAFDGDRHRTSPGSGLASTIAAMPADDRLDDTLLLLQALPNDPGANVLAAVCWNELGRSEEDGQRWASAALCYARALSLVPDDATAVSGRLRTLEASGRAAGRTPHAQNRFVTSLDAFAGGDLNVAEVGLSQLLASSHDEEAAAMRNRVRTLASYRSDRLMREARSALANGRSDLASGAVLEVLLLDPDKRGLTELLAQIQEASVQKEQDIAIQAPTPKRTAPKKKASPESETSPSKSTDGVPFQSPPPVPLDAESGSSIADLSKSAQVARDSGRLLEAVSHWEAILAIDPTHGPTRQALGDEYLAQGMDALSDGNLDRAIDLWERAERANPTDPRTQGYLEWGRSHRDRLSTILGR